MKRTDIYNVPGPGVEFYDLFHEPHRVPPILGDIAFYVRHARRSGGPVLELASGTGRVTIPIAKAGIRVTGLDLSPHMLALARAKAGGLPATFVRGNMRKFDLGRRFRLILIPFRSFQSMLTPEEQRDCLRCVRRHLAPGGLFIVNIFDPKLEYCVPGRSKVISRYRKVTDPATGARANLEVLSRDNDALRQILREKWHFIVRDRRGRLIRRMNRELAIRWTYRTEMAHLLELEGFEPVACHGDFRGGAPRYGSEQVWVCRAAKGKK
ncbi:MAG: class I SAM-dependent methyltransferase [Planctomycetes bacterium]|nr:class I SAM-dependent methyltransferase [Planctomycetota bacterium]